jgi:hypothetical protein
VADMRVEIGMATMRLDGFAPMVAGNEQGTILTKPFRVEGNRLMLNAACDLAQSGSIRAAVLDEHNNPIGGFTTALCTPITGDSIALPVSWGANGSLASLRGQVIRLQFQMQNAKLYSFMLTPVPEPGTCALLVTGLIVLGGYGMKRRRDGTAQSARWMENVP